MEIRPDGPHEANLLQLDSAKIINRLSWHPVWEGEMIARTIDWYRAHYEKGQVISGQQLADFETALAR